MTEHQARTEDQLRTAQEALHTLAFWVHAYASGPSFEEQRTTLVAALEEKAKKTPNQADFLNQLAGLIKAF